MEKENTKNAGLELILKKYKKAFRIPENLNFYSEKDYREAERQRCAQGQEQGAIGQAQKGS